MKFCVINGSPKGKNSITSGYIRFLEKKYPNHQFSFHEVAQKISKIAQDKTKLDNIIEDMKDSDGVIWAFPLYYCLVCGQMMEFMELLIENANERLKDKYALSISTSIHFFDHTAHEYMRALSEDLGMKHFDSYSPAMLDLFEEKGQKDTKQIFEDFVEAIKTNEPVTKLYNKVDAFDFKYEPSMPSSKISIGKKKIAIITESASDDTNIGKMVLRFAGKFESGIEIYDISKIELAAGCLGCCKCALDNVCDLKDKDDHNETYDKIQNADAIIFAGRVKYRFFSSDWQKFINRTFYTGHAPDFLGKQGAVLVSGRVSQLHTMQEVLNCIIKLDGTNHNGIISDESEDSNNIDALLDSLALKLKKRFDDNMIKPAMFPAVGGQKIFRDAVFEHLRFPFIKDHQFYKKHKMYDFKKPSLLTRLMYVLGSTKFGIKKIKPMFRKEMAKPMNKFLSEM